MRNVSHPLTTASQIEIIPLYPDHPEHKQVLSAIRDSFLISENTPGYELKLRSALSDIWFQIFELALPLMQTKDRFDKRNKRLRLMMVYIHEHYAEKISVKDIAGTAFASERECFRALSRLSAYEPCRIYQKLPSSGSLRYARKYKRTYHFYQPELRLWKQQLYGENFP